MKLTALALLLASSPIMYGQTNQVPPPFSMDAKMVDGGNGILVITASSPRPLWQTLESVRRRYGWTVDFEDPLYPVQSLTKDAARRNVLKGGSLVSRLREPANGSPAEELRVLQDVVTQYNTQSLVAYRVSQVSNLRFDIVPTAQSVLDTPIRIDDKQRSLRAEVDAILESLTKTVGVGAVQGGLMNNVMEQTQCSLQHADAVPARQLLDEVLDKAPGEKLWLFTYEPNGNYFGVGVQTTEKWVVGQDGETSVKTFANPKFPPPATR